MSELAKPTMQRSGRLCAICAWLSCALSAACGAATVAAGGGARSRQPFVEPIRTFVAPFVAEARRVGTDATETLYVAGGVRARVEPQGIRLSEQAFASPIVRVRRFGRDQYEFTTQAGTVAVSDGFLGPLRGAERGAGAAAVRDEPLRAADTHDADEQRVRAAAFERFPLAWLHRADVVVDAEGAIVHVIDGAVTIRHGAFLRRAERVVRVDLTDSSDRCHARRWGGSTAIACVRGDGATRVFAIRDGALVQIANAMGMPAVFSNDTSSISFEGVCDAGAGAAADAASPLRVCSRLGGAAWRTWEYRGPGRLIDVFDSLALVMESPPTRGAARRWALYEIDTARVMPIDPGDPASEIVGGALIQIEGAIGLVVRAQSESRSGVQSRVSVTTTRAAVHLVSTYVDARDVAMVDGQRGLAVGRTTRDIADTINGGASWTRRSVHFELAPRDLVLAADDPVGAGGGGGGPRAIDLRLGEWIQCTGHYCRAGALVHYFGDASGTHAFAP